MATEEAMQSEEGLEIITKQPIGADDANARAVPSASDVVGAAEEFDGVPAQSEDNTQGPINVTGQDTGYATVEFHWTKVAYVAHGINRRLGRWETYVIDVHMPSRHCRSR
jgi:hypothetical protein